MIGNSLQKEATGIREQSGVRINRKNYFYPYGKSEKSIEKI